MQCYGTNCDRWREIEERERERERESGGEEMKLANGSTCHIRTVSPKTKMYKSTRLVGKECLCVCVGVSVGGLLGSSQSINSSPVA